MFHIIIVDDEAIIRNGLAAYIQSNHPALTVDALFEDGSDAIAWLREHHADIVLTDVRMSVNSGIDVAAYLFANAPQTKVLFLSAYQEFEYAKQAMKYNVQYYIAKPVKLQELNDALSDLTAQLEAEKRKTEVQAEEKEQLAYLLQTVKRDLYSDILLGVLKEESDIIARAEKYALPHSFLTETQCAAATIRITNHDEWRYGHDELYTYLLNLLRDLKGIQDVTLLTQENLEIVFIGEFRGFSSTDALKQSLTADLAYVCSTTGQMLAMTCSYEVLFCGRNIFDLRDYRSYHKPLDSTLLEEKCKEFLGTILSRDRRGAEEILNALLSYAQTLSAADGDALLTNFFDKIIDTLPPEAADAKALVSVPISGGAIPNDRFEQLLNLIFETTGENNTAIEDRTIIRAKEYIHKHMANDIGLEDVARFVYLSPVYFSRFFKQHTGKTMTEYLTQLRINRAMELLKSHRYKIYEISLQCGYNSSKYFAKIFKQYTGLTPSEYSRRQS